MSHWTEIWPPAHRAMIWLLARTLFTGEVRLRAKGTAPPAGHAGSALGWRWRPPVTWTAMSWAGGNVGEGNDGGKAVGAGVGGECRQGVGVGGDRGDARVAEPGTPIVVIAVPLDGFVGGGGGRRRRPAGGQVQPLAAEDAQDV